MRLIKVGQNSPRANMLREARERAEDAATIGDFRGVATIALTECHVCRRKALWFTGTAYVPAYCGDHWISLQLTRPLVTE